MTTWVEEGHAPSTYSTDTITSAHLTDPDPHPGYLTPAEGDAAYATAGHTHAAVVKTVRVPHTFTISGDVFLPSGDLYYIPPFFVSEPTGQTVNIVAARHRINSGTSATVEVRVNGTAIAGFSALSVTTTTALTDPADVAVADGDAVSLVVTAVDGSPKNLTFSLYLEYTV